MNKDDYLVWRANPVTHEFMQATIKEMDDMIAELVSTSGDNQLQDKYRRGVIEGVKWLLDWVPVVENDNDEDIDNDASTSERTSGTY